MKTKRQRQAKVLRDFRKVHRMLGATLFLGFFIISISGLLLGWKKNSGDFLLSKTHKGTTAELKNWLSLQQLLQHAEKTFTDSLPNIPIPVLDRIDIRKEKGSLKFIYENYYGIQLDGATGEVLAFGKRRSDFIENIHDASILDAYFTTNGFIKILYTTVMSIALLLFTITGFWLWYGPKRMRKIA